MRRDPSGMPSHIAKRDPLAEANSLPLEPDSSSHPASVPRSTLGRDLEDRDRRAEYAHKVALCSHFMSLSDGGPSVSYRDTLGSPTAGMSSAPLTDCFTANSCPMRLSLVLNDLFLCRTRSTLHVLAYGDIDVHTTNTPFPSPTAFQLVLA